MLIAYKHHMPSSLTAGETKTKIIEEIVTTSPIFFPKLFFKNVEVTSEFDIKVTHILDLGVSNNPLNAGTFYSEEIKTPDTIENLLDPGVIVKDWNYTLTPDDLLVLPLETIIDPNNNLTEQHEISITNNGVTTSIIQIWLVGAVDSAIDITQPELTEI